MFLLFGAPVVDSHASNVVLNATSEKDPEEANPNLVQEDPGLDANFPAAIQDIERLADKTVDDILRADEPVGVAEFRKEASDTLRSPGLSAPGLAAGELGDKGHQMPGDGGLQGMTPSGAWIGRSPATKLASGDRGRREQGERTRRGPRSCLAYARTEAQRQRVFDGTRAPTQLPPPAWRSCRSSPPVKRTSTANAISTPSTAV